MKTISVLIAPDKFKGSLTSEEVAMAIDKGFRQSAIKKIHTSLLPLADGGDGFVEVTTLALGGVILKQNKIPDACGRLKTVRYGWVKKSRTALLDVAGICGIASLKKSELNPLKASSYGVGLMVKKLIQRGAKEILIGLGGSATNDGGMGLASGLGYIFKDAFGQVLKPNGENLLKIKKIESPRNLKLCKIRAATDVKNPLLGAQGATCIFGPQKGATPKILPILENGMKNFSFLANREAAKTPGAGAAGGLGYAMIVFGNGKLVNGFDLVAELTQLEKEIKKADLVITGEGCLDAQTASGKVPEGVRRLAAKYHKPVVAFAGIIQGGQKKYTRTFALMDIAASKNQAICQASKLLTQQSCLEFGKIIDEIL